MLTVTIARPEKKDGIGFYGGRVALLRCTKDLIVQRKSKIKGDLFTKNIGL